MKLDPNINKIYFDKCIICMLNPPNSYEHLIPASIGGIIEWKALCKNCNDKLGHDMIKDIKIDPRIRIAITHLKDKLPDLFERIENRQKYEGADDNGKIIKHVYKDGVLKVLQAKEEDSLIKGMEDTEEFIKATFRKNGMEDDEINEELQKFYGADFDKLIQLPNGISVIKKNTNLYQSFKGAIFLNHRFLVLLAYEYMSLFLGHYIYDNSLNYIREYILNNTRSDLIDVEEYGTGKCAPIHRLYCENSIDKITINIVLFGYLYFKVILKEIPFRFQEFVILEDLEEKKAFAANSIVEAKAMYYKYEIRKIS